GGGPQTVQRSTQMPGIAVKLRSDPGQNIVAQGQFLLRGHLFQNAQPRGVVGRLQRADQTTGQPCDELGSERPQLAHRAVSRKDKLTMLAEECVDGMDKFYLRRLLAGEELHVVDQQQLYIPNLAAKIGRARLA